MRVFRFVPLAMLSSMLAAAPSFAGQQAPSLSNGKALFQGLCSRCHGIDGTGDEGPSLARPTLPRAKDDDALRTIVRDGLPDRGMPRIRRLTSEETEDVVAFVRSLGRVAAAPLPGDPARGAALYQRLGCATCHIVEGSGTGFGPELSDIGLHRSATYLRRAVLEPGAALPKGVLPVPARGYDEFLPVRLTLRDGREVRGMRINEDTFTIQVRDLRNEFHSFRKADVRQLDKEFGKSVMTSYRDRLSGSELDDLVAYLSRLGGAK